MFPAYLKCEYWDALEIVGHLEHFDKGENTRLWGCSETKNRGPSVDARADAARGRRASLTQVSSKCLMLVGGTHKV